MNNMANISWERKVATPSAGNSLPRQHTHSLTLSLFLFFFFSIFMKKNRKRIQWVFDEESRVGRRREGQCDHIGCVHGMFDRHLHAWVNQHVFTRQLAMSQLKKAGKHNVTVVHLQSKLLQLRIMLHRHPKFVHPLSN
jgi:hypothetical protein